MNADVRGDVITLDSYCTASAPLAGEIEIVGAFAADMALAHVILREVLATDVATSDAFATWDVSTRCAHANPITMMPLGGQTFRPSSLERADPACSDGGRNDSRAHVSNGTIYVESIGAVAPLAAALPPATQVVCCRALRVVHRLHGWRGIADGLLGLLGPLGGRLLLRCSCNGFGYGLLHLDRDVA